MIDEIDKQMFFKGVTQLMEQVPNMTLVHMMECWRSTPNSVGCNIVNYGSVFLEQNPGIGSIKLYQLPFTKFKT